MREVDLTEPLQLDTGMYDAVQRAGNWIRLRPHHPGEEVDMPVWELSRRLVGAHRYTISPRSIEVVPDAARNHAFNWEQHLIEIETGFGRTGEMRPQYDPAKTSQEQRIAEKISELALHHGRTLSRATVMRKLKEYRTCGVVGLIDGRATRAYGPVDRLDERVHEALCQVMAAQAQKSSGTKSRIIDQTRAILLRTYGADAPEMPSRATMYRCVDSLDAGRHTTGRATTRRSQANRPKRTFADASTLLPGAQIQIDSTKLDVLIQGVDGPERPTLTIMLDVATRSILAWTLRLTATKGVDHAVLLAQALTPFENRPSRTQQRASVRARFPHLSLLADAEHERARRSAPHVFPRAVTIDNGRDYLSGTFTSALKKFGIDVTLSAPHTPTDKPHVERTFSSINTLFVQYLPGYVGKSPVDRGYKVENDTQLDLWSLYELFDDFVAHVWQNRPHEGLTDRYEPTIKRSPNQMIAVAAGITTTLSLPLTERDYIELLPIEHRAIGSAGIQLKGRFYDSDLLHPLRGAKSSNPSRGSRWAVHYDPYNWQTVWLVAADGELIPCTERNAHLADHPYSTEFDDSRWLFHEDPDSTEPTSDEYVETERTKIAREGAALAGVPIHQPPLPAPARAPHEWAPLPTDLDGYDVFDPAKD